MRQKLLFALFLVAGCAWQLHAQFTPQGFNYQSVVRDGNGNALSNQTVTLLFTIRSGAANGPIAYAEKQTVSTNEFGLINLTIGIGGQPQLGDFTGINWSGGAKFLTVSLETSPGQFDDLGATQLMSVPYALYAQAAGNSVTPGDNWGSQTVQTSPTISGNGTAGNPISLAQQNAQNGQVLKWDGTKWTPQNDIMDNGFNGTVTQINTGNGIVGGPITGSGTIGLSNTGVVPGYYGSATQIPVLHLDATGRVLGVDFAIPQPGAVDIDGAAGINVTQNGFNFIITNTGDTNPNDDLTTVTQASGDVSGPFANLQINANTIGSLEITPNAVGNSELADNAVSTTKILNGAVTAAKLDDMNASNGQVIKWNGTTWAPATDVSGSVSLTSGAGINVSGTSPNFTITNTGDTNPNDDLTSATQANGDISGPFSNLQIDAGVVSSPEIANGGVASADLADNAVTSAKVANGAITAAKLDDMNATAGQVLKWNGTNWVPAADASGITTLIAGNGIDIFGFGGSLTIENTGDTDPTNDITTLTQADGDISGPFNNLQIKSGTVGTPEIAAGAVTAAKLDDMNANNGQVLKWNGNAWGPANDQTSGGGGDDWGDQVVASNNTISGDGTPGSPLGIAAQGATNGQVLKFNGTTWLPATDAGGDNWGSQTAQVGNALTGNGTIGSPLNLAKQNANTGQVLKWDGLKWVPGDDETGGGGGTGDNYTAGSGIDITGSAPNFVINNTGDLDPSDDLTDTDQAGGDLTGPFSNLQIKPNAVGSPEIANSAVTTGKLADGAVTGVKIDDMGANVNQVLKWNGSTWLPANDVGGGNNYAAGTGISITGSAPNFTINNTGDADKDPTNELQTLSLNGATLKISGTNSQVKFDTLLAGMGGGGFWSAVSNNPNNIYSTNSGNVGIGTLAPAVKLHVRGAGEALRVEGANPRIGLANGAGPADGYLSHGAGGLVLGTNDSSAITLRTGGNNALIIEGGEGSVGMGGTNTGTSTRLKLYSEKACLALQNTTSGDNWEFWVDENTGSMQLYNSASGNFPVGTFATNGVYLPSDRRLKRDILGLPNVLDKILRLQPVSYHYNQEHAGTTTSIGFLAQDVQGLFPELVGTTAGRDREGDFLSLNYAGISVLAVKAIQEQQGQIELLRRENEALRQRTDNLEARLLRLEKLLPKE